jgi:hypothetical protein
MVREGAEEIRTLALGASTCVACYKETVQAPEFLLCLRSAPRLGFTRDCPAPKKWYFAPPSFSWYYMPESHSRHGNLAFKGFNVIVPVPLDLLIEGTPSSKIEVDSE